MAKRKKMSPEEREARRKGYKHTLDEALTIGTGMNKEEREEFRKDVDYWMGVRKKSKEGSKKWREASNKIAAHFGWAQKY